MPGFSNNTVSRADAVSEIRRGAVLSYVTIAIANLSGLLLTPFIIRSLGKSEYGLYMLVGSLAAYLGVLDFGLNNAVIRFVAQSVARNDRSGESRFLGAALVVNAVATAAILVLGGVFYIRVDEMFGATLNQAALDDARLMLLLLIASVVLTVSGSLFAAISTGHERFTFPKSVNIVRYLLRIAAVLLVLASGGGAVALVAVDAVLSLFVFLANALYAVRALGACFAIRPFDPGLVRGVFAYSAWVFLFTMIGQFQWQTGQLILGATMGTEMVAVYGVGIVLGTYYGAFSTALTSLFMPRATRMSVTGVDAEGMTAEMTRIGRVALFVLWPILVGFACFGQDFVRLWAGDDFQDAWTVAMIIMLVYTVPLAQSFANQLLEAKGLFAFKAAVYLLFLLAGIVIGYFLADRLGVTGMAMGIALGWTAALIVMNFYYQRVLGLNIGTYFTGVLKGNSRVFVVALLFGLVLRMVPGDGWTVLVVRVVLFSVFYAVATLQYGMNERERFEIQSMMKRMPWIRAS